jgi:hypothetical protein
VNTVEATTLTLAVFSVAGILPALAIVGPSGSTLALAILIGAVETGVAGAFSLAVAWSTLPWFCIIAVVGMLASFVILIQKRRHRPVFNGGSSHLRTLRHCLPQAAVFAVLSLTLVWCLVPLRVPSVGWDARAIWLLRASWFVRGHDFLLVAFRSPAAVIAHASYPPLISTAVASSWQLTGNHTERLGVVIVALLNASATMATSWVMVEAGRNVGRRKGPDKGGSFAEVAGIVCAVLFVLVTFGVFGPFSTNGYADPLWSVAAVGAIGYGLILPPNRKNLGAAAILLAVSGLTKTEGTATAIVLTILITLRASGFTLRNLRQDQSVSGIMPRRELDLRRAARVNWRRVVTGATGVVCLSLWPILARLEHATKDVNTSGIRQGTWTSRAHLTLSAIAPHLHVLLVAVPLALGGGLLLRGHRKQGKLGNDVWAWLGLIGGLSVVVSAYITGPGNTAFWLLTSVHRTTMFAATAAWLIIAVWAVVAASSAEGAANSQSLSPVPMTTLDPTVSTEPSGRYLKPLGGIGVIAGSHNLPGLDLASGGPRGIDVLIMPSSSRSPVCSGDPVGINVYAAGTKGADCSAPAQFL